MSARPPDELRLRVIARLAAWTALGVNVGGTIADLLQGQYGAAGLTAVLGMAAAFWLSFMDASYRWLDARADADVARQRLNEAALAQFEAALRRGDINAELNGVRLN